MSKEDWQMTAARENHTASDPPRPLAGKRLMVCGKGGSGKSTVTALLALVLEQKDYDVVVIDGDASNPEGLIRLMFGIGVEGEPTPLVEFFGGLDVVTCPVDDPSPLTRINDTVTLSSRPVDLTAEVPQEYWLQRGNIRLLQVGKISTYGQGCDGPLEKVVRDFVIVGEAVSIVDMKAGIEHFGRGVPNANDIVIGVLDYTLESVSIARRMAEFCIDAGISDYWLILNKLGSDEIAAIMLEKLGDLGRRVLGKVHFDPDLVRRGLVGDPVVSYAYLDDFCQISERLEALLAIRRSEVNSGQPPSSVDK